MNEEPRKEQNTLSVIGGEPECIEFLRNKGLDIEIMHLSYFARWKARGHIDRLENYRWEDDPMVREILIRDEFIEKYGFAILTRNAIEAMRPYAPLLELGAGSGYWSYELQKAGIDVIATDPQRGEYAAFKKLIPQCIAPRWQSFYTDMVVLEAVDAVRTYPDRNLLIVWPSLGESWAADALATFTGQVVIYMGEGHGNATADDRFHELLDERFGNQDGIPMPHFEGLYDRQLLICKTPKQITKGT